MILDESDFNKSVVSFKVLGSEDKDNLNVILKCPIGSRAEQLIRKESVALFKK